MPGNRAAANGRDRRRSVAGRAGAEDAAKADAAPPIVSPAERRQLTIVFIDIVDSTGLSEQIDPESFFGILKKYRNICERIVEQFAGVVARSVGDGLLVYFGLPRAHEDDAERAVQAALSIVETLNSQRFETNEIGPVQIDVRIAINTGLVVVGELAEGDGNGFSDVFGTNAIIAARLQEIAPRNAVIIGSATYELVHAAFECELIGRHKLKGMTKAIPAWRAVGPKSTESRFERRRKVPLTPLCGRSEEFERLSEAWLNAERGEGSVALISGEPGIGKSRLVLDFRRSLENRPHEILFYQGSPLHKNTPLAPVIEQIRRAAQIHADDPPERALEKVSQLIERAQEDPAEYVSYHGSVLSIPPQGGYVPADLSSHAERQRALDRLAQVPLNMSERTPVLMILEDIQWMDPSSLEVAQRVIDRIDGKRLLCILTGRPDQAFDVSGPVSRLELSRLTPDETRHMVGELTEGRALPGFVMDRLVKQSDGIPLVVEELTRAVLASGALRRAGGRYRVNKTLPKPLVPSTIQDSLMERLDRLGEAKHVAQIASVLGRNFTFDALMHVSRRSEGSLADALHELEGTGLIRRRGDDRFSSYIFTHAMLQEEAYASLLKDFRRELHQRAAEWLEGQIGGRDSEQIAVLAYHLSAAAQNEKAVVYWLKAGKAAIKRSAHKEAIAHLKEGLDNLALCQDKERGLGLEIELQLHLAMAYIALEGWSGPNVDAAYHRALQLSRTHGTLRQTSMALWGVSRSKMVATEFDASLELAEEYLALAGKSGDEELALMAHAAAATSHFYAGNLETARRSVEYVREHYRTRDHRDLVERYQHDPKVVVLVYGGHIYWLLGQPSEGRKCCTEARRLARRIGHPFMLALVHVIGASDHLYEHKTGLAWRSLQRGLALAEEHGLSLYRAFASLWQVEAVVAHEPGDEILAKLSGQIDNLKHFDISLTVPFYQTSLALEFGRRGRADQGRKLAADAERIMDRTGESWFRPEVYRVQAEMVALDRTGDAERAARLFDHSLKVARRMKALGWELRTALSFAEHLCKQGEIDRARALLAKTRRKFPATETSTDLKRAARLEEDLS